MEESDFSSKRIIIYYYSYHTMSTKKLLEGVVKDFSNITLVPVTPDVQIDLENYDYIGFASGIYFMNFGKPIHDLLKRTESLQGKPCFTLSTSGGLSEGYKTSIKDLIEKKGGIFLDGFNCLGFDCIFPINLFGGKNKGKPDDEDIKNAQDFLKATIK